MTQNDWTDAVIAAVSEMTILRFYPAEVEQRESIGKLLLRMVEFGRDDQLKWLVRTMVDRVGEWSGPVELRGVFCTKFRPADGIEADCKVSPGFTPFEMEMQSRAPRLEQGHAVRLLEGITGKDANRLT